jgi:hypothetical protein
MVVECAFGTGCDRHNGQHRLLTRENASCQTRREFAEEPVLGVVDVVKLGSLRCLAVRHVRTPEVTICTAIRNYAQNASTRE